MAAFHELGELIFAEDEIEAASPVFVAVRAPGLAGQERTGLGLCDGDLPSRDAAAIAQAGDHQPSALRRDLLDLWPTNPRGALVPDVHREAHVAACEEKRLIERVVFGRVSATSNLSTVSSYIIGV